MEREKEVVAGHDDEERAGGAKPQEPLLGAKLRRALSVAKRVGPCTPVCAWKLEGDVEEAGPSWADDGVDTAADANQSRARTKQQHPYRVSFGLPGAAGAAVSARQLGANLWEVQDPPRYRMGRRSERARRRRDEKLAGLFDLSPLRPQEQVAASNQAITPASPLDLKGKSGYSRKTSTELLKVLNRIWSLEEQHTSTVSLVNRLQLELENAQACIQELSQEKQSNQHEIDSLTKQIAEDKLARKSKEQERIRAAVKSLRAELEDERRLRRHSESLHRRLVKELSEIRSAFSKMMRDLEGEKAANSLLEDLCDEFAKGIREYEEEMRELKPKSEKGPGCRRNRLILDFSEAWLDERLQIKLAESRGYHSEKKGIMDKLECEVGAFLQVRGTYNLNDDVLVDKDILKERCLRRHSLESIHLNGAVSAPRYAEDEDSVASDVHCFELNVGTNATERHDSLKHNDVQHVEKLEHARNSNVAKKTVGSSEGFRYQGSSSSRTKFDGHKRSVNDVKVQFMNEAQGIQRHNISGGGKDANLNVDVFSCQKLEEGEAQEDALGKKVKPGGTHLLNHIIEDSVIESEFGDFCKHHPEGEHMEGLGADLCQHHSLAVGREDASGHGISSPVQHWSYHHISPHLQMPQPSKLPQAIKENTLKAKLLEARLEGQHARLKTPRDSSVGV